MNFDRVARLYRWLEIVIFRNQLQQARTAFVREIGTTRRALIAGEGDGRFLAELLRRQRDLSVDCIEASACMLELAQRRVHETRARFVRADIFEVALPAQHYDLLVTHFFLDCFAGPALQQLITRLSHAAAPNAIWLVADFCEPPRGWRKLRARALIATMYRFFRLAAGIEAQRLIDYEPLLREQGFTRTKEVLSGKGMIRSQMWRRSSG